jgi:hypothetical protein
MNCFFSLFKLRRISPTRVRNFPYSVFCRCLGTNTIWYLQSHLTCDILDQSCIGNTSCLPFGALPRNYLYYPHSCINNKANDSYWFVIIANILLNVIILGYFQRCTRRMGSTLPCCLPFGLRFQLRPNTSGKPENFRSCVVKGSM